MALQLRRTTAPNPEPLEFWFSACLSAAQSAYYVLDKAGGLSFKHMQKSWRDGLGKQAADEFGWMIGVRDADVHLAQVPGEVLPKVVPASPSEVQLVGGNDALYGPFELPSHVNRDNKIVRSAVTMGSLGLYIDTPTGPEDAEDLCHLFVDHVHSLLAAVTASLG